MTAYDKIDCSLVDRIAIAQRFQPSPHLIDGMYITLQDLLLQWLCHLTIVDFLRTLGNQVSSFALGLASVILIFLIFVSLNTITLFSLSESWLETGSCHSRLASLHRNTKEKDTSSLCYGFL